MPTSGTSGLDWGKRESIDHTCCVIRILFVKRRKGKKEVPGCWPLALSPWLLDLATGQRRPDQAAREGAHWLAGRVALGIRELRTCEALLRRSQLCLCRIP